MESQGWNQGDHSGSLGVSLARWWYWRWRDVGALEIGVGVYCTLSMDWRKTERSKATSTWLVRELRRGLCIIYCFPRS